MSHCPPARHVAFAEKMAENNGRTPDGSYPNDWPLKVSYHYGVSWDAALTPDGSGDAIADVTLTLGGNVDPKRLADFLVGIAETIGGVRFELIEKKAA